MESKMGDLELEWTVFVWQEVWFEVEWKCPETDDRTAPKVEPKSDRS